MENKMLSIIVPVYNSEKYLSYCVDSILAQTFSDFELILVDDGSTDGSPAICDEYAKKDVRIRVIHQKNAGPGAARNSALNIATGEWIGFCDSDDWIEVNTYETVLKIAEEKKADLVQWELIMEHENKAVPNKCHVAGFFTAAQSGTYYRSVVYASIFRRKILIEHSIRFPTDSCLSEDALFNYQYYLKAERCYYHNECFYHFRQNPNSITHNITREKWMGEISVLRKIEELAELNGGYEYVEKIQRNVKIQALFFKEGPDYEAFRSVFPKVKVCGKSDIKSFSSNLYFFCIEQRLDFLARCLFRLALLRKSFRSLNTKGVCR